MRGLTRIADLNGDGFPDLVVLNRGDGSFAARQDFPTGSEPSGLAIADLNGGGKADVVSANHSGILSVLLGNGDGTFQATTTTRSAAGRSRSSSSPT